MLLFSLSLSLFFGVFKSPPHLSLPILMVLMSSILFSTSFSYLSSPPNYSIYDQCKLSLIPRSDPFDSLFTALTFSLNTNLTLVPLYVVLHLQLDARSQLRLRLDRIWREEVVLQSGRPSSGPYSRRRFHRPPQGYQCVDLSFLPFFFSPIIDER